MPFTEKIKKLSPISKFDVGLATFLGACGVIWTSYNKIKKNTADHIDEYIIEQVKKVLEEEKKNNKTGFFQAKYQPLRQMEEIFIYYKKLGTYNPQMIGNKYHPKRNVKVGGRNGYYGDKLKDKQNEITEEGGHTGRFPSTFKEWNIRKDKSGITRTDEQIDYFIKTYSNENDTILDMTCHNNYVGDRCKSLNRNYIGVDINLN